MQFLAFSAFRPSMQGSRTAGLCIGFIARQCVNTWSTSSTSWSICQRSTWWTASSRTSQYYRQVKEQQLGGRLSFTEWFELSDRKDSHFEALGSYMEISPCILLLAKHLLLLVTCYFVRDCEIPLQCTNCNRVWGWASRCILVTGENSAKKDTRTSRWKTQTLCCLCVFCLLVHVFFFFFHRSYY